MSAFKLQTLKLKLWAIVAASFIARVIIFFVLPSTPSSLAPDEGTYAGLAKWISESKPANDFPIFGGGLYLSSRSVIIPASTLIKFGINELNAVRIISTIYGLLALCALAYLCSKLLVFPTPEVERNKRNERLTLGLLIVYAFLPSHFIWSNLGLREASNEFWLIMTFVGVFMLYKDGQPKKPIIAALIFISIICTFSSRPQVGLVLVVTLLIYSILKIKNKLTYLLIASVLAGLFAGYLATTSFVEVTSDVYVAKNSSTTSTDASKLCDGTQTKVEYQGEIYNCVKSGTITKRERTSNVAEVAIDQVEALPGKQIANQAGAASMIQRLDCPLNESSETGKYGCLAFRAPYMTLTFLFRPLPFIDTTSMSSVFAAAENTIWIAMFVLIAYKISKVRRIPFLRELAPSLIFFSLYVVGAGSYEGNMGTAFRHKSLILWGVLLLLMAALSKNSQEEHMRRRNKPTESAV
jgi:hypothetical protein